MRERATSMCRAPFVLVFVFLGGQFLSASEANLPRRDAPQEADRGVLLLVRGWDPKSGQLVGWMPMHGAAITLQSIDLEPLNFNLNESVVMKMPYRPGALTERNEVRIAPEAKNFEGRKWLPVIREVNLVRIRKSFFYVKSIVFDETKWRFAAR